MSEASSANHNTKAKSKDDRSRKRRFAGQQQGPRKRSRYASYDTNLTKGKNLILASCDRYNSKRCGRDLKLVFSEYIEEYMKKHNITRDPPQTEQSSKPQQPTPENTDETAKTTTETSATEAKATTKEAKATTVETVTTPETVTTETKETAPETVTTKESKVTTDDSKVEKETEQKEQKEPEKSAPVAVSDAINAELASYHKRKVCEWIDGPSGLVIVDILVKGVKASDLLEFVFEKFYPKRPTLSMYANRLHPLDCTCFSRTEDMITLGTRMLGEVDWSVIPKEHKYAVNYMNRGNKKLSKDRRKIVVDIAGGVPAEYQVDLSNPQVVVLVQTFGRNAGVGIIKNNSWAKHKEYNLANFE